MPRRPWRIAAAYFVLLIASQIVDWFIPKSAPPTDLRFVSVHAVDHGGLQPSTIRLAYRDSAPDSSQVPVLLVHGSPGSSEVLQKLAELLAPRFRVIVPDPPGSGAPTRDLADYSFRAHGEYLIELLDALHVPKAQLIGFSMGGGVVLSAAHLGPWARGCNRDALGPGGPRARAHRELRREPLSAWGATSRPVAPAKRLSSLRALSKTPVHR